MPSGHSGWTNRLAARVPQVHADGERFPRFAIDRADFELAGDGGGGEHHERESRQDGGDRQERGCRLC